MTSREPVVSRRWLSATIAAITVLAATVTASPSYTDRAGPVTSWARHGAMTLDTVGPRAHRSTTSPRCSAYPETTHLLRWSGVTKRRLGITPPTTQLQVRGTASRSCTVDFPRFLGSTSSVDRRTLGGAQSRSRSHTLMGKQQR